MGEMVKNSRSGHARRQAGISNEEFLEKAADLFLLVLNTRASGTPVKAERLAEITGVDVRIVADVIRTFQRREFPIISGANGYKYASTKFEWFRHVVKEKHRGETILANVSRMKKNYVQEPNLFSNE